MDSNVIGLVAFDLVLRIVFAGMMRIAFVIKIPRMDLDDLPADMPGFGIPGDVIADFERVFHFKLTGGENNGFL